MARPPESDGIETSMKALLAEANGLTGAAGKDKLRLLILRVLMGLWRTQLETLRRIEDQGW